MFEHNINVGEKDFWMASWQPNRIFHKSLSCWQLHQHRTVTYVLIFPLV